MAAGNEARLDEDLEHLLPRFTPTNVPSIPGSKRVSPKSYSMPASRTTGTVARVG